MMKMKNKNIVRLHVKTGDEVVVIAGGAKGRRGTIKKVIRKKSLVVLEGTDDRARGTDEGGKKLSEQGVSAQMLEKHRLVKPQLHYFKKSQTHPSGAMLWLESPIHSSNVMKTVTFEARRSGSNPQRLESKEN